MRVRPDENPRLALMRTPLALVLLTLVSGPVAAQRVAAAPVAAPVSAPWTVAQMTKPRSVSDCEQVKGDLAYNQCLSMFGPAAHTKGGAGAGSGDGSVAAATAAPTEKAVEQPRRGRRGHAVRRGGRQGASFTVGHRAGGHHGGRRHRRR